jgi:hypothetical protein
MANALTLTAAAAPAAIAGIKAGANSNGGNSAAWTYSNGAGVLDTIANAELLKGVSTSSRLYAFLTTSFVNQTALNAGIAALGVVAFASGADNLRFVLLTAPGVPNATITPTAATGTLYMSLSYSQSA